MNIRHKTQKLNHKEKSRTGIIATAVLSAFALSCGSLQASQALAEMPVQHTDEYSTVGDNTIFIPRDYSQFAKLSNAAIEFEVQVIQSGLLEDVEKRDIASLIGLPSYKLNYLVGKEFQLSDFQVGPPDQDLLTAARSLTPFHVVSNHDSNKAVVAGNYRIFDVGVRVNGAKFFHRAMEVCRSECILIDLNIPSINADVSNSLQDYHVDITDGSVIEGVQVSKDSASFPCVLASNNKQSRTYRYPAYEKYIGNVFAGARIYVKAAEATFLCYHAQPAACKISASYFAEQSSVSTWGGYKGKCDRVSADGSDYDINKMKVGVVTGCAYHTKGSITYDLKESGNDGAFKISGGLKGTGDLGSSGEMRNGAVIAEDCESPLG